MTLILTLAQNFEQLRSDALQGYKLPELVPVTIQVSAECITDQQEASRKAASYDAENRIGWCRAESWAGRTPAMPANIGPPLDGEWVVSETQSIRLLYCSGT